MGLTVALKSIESTDLKTFASTFMSACFIEAFVHGNSSKQASLDLMDLIQTKLNASPVPLVYRGLALRSVLLSDPMLIKFPVHHVDNVNSAIEYVIQVGEPSPLLRAKVWFDIDHGT